MAGKKINIGVLFNLKHGKLHSVRIRNQDVNGPRPVLHLATVDPHFGTTAPLIVIGNYGTLLYSNMASQYMAEFN